MGRQAVLPAHCLNMEKHETKYCPLCQQPFVCRVGDVGRCQCSSVTLHQETREFLERMSFDCLCARCLLETDRKVMADRK